MDTVTLSQTAWDLLALFRGDALHLVFAQRVKDWSPEGKTALEELVAKGFVETVVAHRLIPNPGKIAILESTSTGLVRYEQDVLVRLLDEVANAFMMRALNTSDNNAADTLIHDGHRVEFWVNALDEKGPTDEWQKATLLDALHDLARKVGKWGSDDVDFIHLAQDTETRQRLMRAYDIWSKAETPYQIGEREDTWLGGRMALLLHFFADRIAEKMRKENGE